MNLTDQKTTGNSRMALPPLGQTPEICVPETLTAPHRLVAAIMEADLQSAKLARARGWPFQSICQSKADIRRLRILSALYEALEKRGHRLEHPENSVLPVWCVINREPIDFYIIDYVRPTKIPLSPEELKKPLNIANGRTTKIVRQPTDQLVLLAKAEFKYKKRRWSDSNGPLEKQLGAIILKFEEMAERAAVRRVELAKSNREIEEKIARENEERARWEKEAEDRQRLRELAADWSEAQRVRHFIDAIATRLQSLPDPDGHGRSWLDWARAAVEELDPMGAHAETTLCQLLEGHGLQKWEDEAEETDEW